MFPVRYPGQSTLTNLIEDLFSFEFSNGIVSRWNQTRPEFPPMTISEDKNSKFIEIKMAIAGFSKDDISIEAEDEFLHIKGKKKEPFDNYEKDSVRFIRRNLTSDSFSRTFSFSDNFYNFREPKVTLKDGLLTIRIEKDPSLISPKKSISIE